MIDRVKGRVVKVSPGFPKHKILVRNQFQHLAKCAGNDLEREKSYKTFKLFLNFVYLRHNPFDDLGLGSVLIWLVPGARAADLVRL